MFVSVPASGLMYDVDVMYSRSWMSIRVVLLNECLATVGSSRTACVGFDGSATVAVVWRSG